MKTPEEWFALLSEDGKADVMKTQIHEQAQTERARLAEEGTTERSKLTSDGYHWVRGVFVAVLLLIACCGTCVAHRGVEAWEKTNSPPPSIVKVAPSSSAKAE